MFSLAYGNTISEQWTLRNLFLRSSLSVDSRKTPHCFNSTKYKVLSSTSAFTLNVSVNSCISFANSLILDSKLNPTFGDDDKLVKMSGVIGDSNERSFK